MPRNSDDYSEYEVPAAEMFREDDENDNDLDDAEAESGGMLDRMADVILGEAEIVAEIDDDDEDDSEAELFRRKKKTAKKATGFKLKAKKLTAPKASSAIRKAAMGAVLPGAALSAQLKRGLKPVVSSRQAPVTSKAGVKRLLVKAGIVIVVLGVAMAILRTTPLAPVVDKANSMAKKAVGKVVNYRSKGMFGG